MTYVSTIENVSNLNKYYILKVSIKNILNMVNLHKTVIWFFFILHVIFVSKLFMILTNSGDIWNRYIKNVLYALKVLKNLSIFILKIINRLFNILKSLIFIVKSETVLQPSFKTFLYLNRLDRNMSKEFIKKQRKTIHLS